MGLSDSSSIEESSSFDNSSVKVPASIRDAVTLHVALDDRRSEWWSVKIDNYVLTKRLSTHQKTPAYGEWRYDLAEAPRKTDDSGSFGSIQNVIATYAYDSILKKVVQTREKPRALKTFDEPMLLETPFKVKHLRAKRLAPPETSLLYPSVVMAKLPGKTLRRYLQNTSIITYSHRFIVTQNFLEALKTQVSDYGLVHFDISCSNILVSDALDVSIIDFDRAAELGSLTADSEIHSKSNYRPPAKEELSQAWDIYSAGKVCRNIWMQQPLEAVDRLIEQMISAKAEDRPSIEVAIAKFAAMTPPCLRDFVEKVEQFVLDSSDHPCIDNISEALFQVVNDWMQADDPEQEKEKYLPILTLMERDQLVPSWDSDVEDESEDDTDDDNTFDSAVKDLQWTRQLLVNVAKPSGGLEGVAPQDLKRWEYYFAARLMRTLWKTWSGGLRLANLFSDFARKHEQYGESFLSAKTFLFSAKEILWVQIDLAEQLRDLFQYVEGQELKPVYTDYLHSKLLSILKDLFLVADVNSLQSFRETHQPFFNALETGRQQELLPVWMTVNKNSENSQSVDIQSVLQDLLQQSEQSPVFSNWDFELFKGFLEDHASTCPSLEKIVIEQIIKYLAPIKPDKAVIPQEHVFISKDTIATLLRGWHRYELLRQCEYFWNTKLTDISRAEENAGDNVAKAICQTLFDPDNVYGSDDEFIAAVFNKIGPYEDYGNFSLDQKELRGLDLKQKMLLISDLVNLPSNRSLSPVNIFYQRNNLVVKILKRAPQDKEEDGAKRIMMALWDESLQHLPMLTEIARILRERDKASWEACQTILSNRLWLQEKILSYRMSPNPVVHGVALKLRQDLHPAIDQDALQAFLLDSRQYLQDCEKSYSSIAYPLMEALLAILTLGFLHLAHGIYNKCATEKGFSMRFFKNETAAELKMFREDLNM